MVNENPMHIPKFVRIDPVALKERAAGTNHLIVGPADFTAVLKPGYGVVVAGWSQDEQVGVVSRLGVVLRVGLAGAAVHWVQADLRYKPNPSGPSLLDPN
jgi:hypothetical protein